jgi:hypothetical protein
MLLGQTHFVVAQMAHSTKFNRRLSSATFISLSICAAQWSIWSTTKNLLLASSTGFSLGVFIAERAIMLRAAPQSEQAAEELGFGVILSEAKNLSSI